jgi:hypothetical protein
VDPFESDEEEGDSEGEGDVDEETGTWTAIRSADHPLTVLPYANGTSSSENGFTGLSTPTRAAAAASQARRNGLTSGEERLRTIGRKRRSQHSLLQLAVDRADAHGEAWPFDFKVWTREKRERRGRGGGRRGEEGGEERKEKGRRREGEGKERKSEGAGMGSPLYICRLVV